MSRGKKGKVGKLSSGAVAVIVIICIIFYLMDALGGTGNKDIEAECEFHFIDVGQGDATMILTGEGAVVIDAGPGDHADSTLEYIKSYTDRIDYLILTHPHEDHIGGADEIIENIKVENVIMSDAYSDTLVFTTLLDAIEAADVNVIEAVPEDSYEAGGIKLTILAPLSEFTDLNDYSIVTHVEYGKTSVVVTGDVENHSEKLMVERFGPLVLSADILQVGHHGSSTSNSAKFIDAVSPKWAVISCGEGNSYGHPHKETLDKLKKRGIEWFRTDELGHIVFESDGENIRVVANDQ